MRLAFTPRTGSNAVVLTAALFAAATCLAQFIVHAPARQADSPLQSVQNATLVLAVAWTTFQLATCPPRQRGRWLAASCAATLLCLVQMTDWLVAAGVIRDDWLLDLPPWVIAPALIHRAIWHGKDQPWVKTLWRLGLFLQVVSILADLFEGRAVAGFSAEDFATIAETAELMALESYVVAVILYTLAPASRLISFTHCIVHAGSHKTGTTSLQNVLATCRGELARAGVSYPAYGRKARNHNALAHRLATCAEDELPALRRQLKAVPDGMGARPDGAATLLLSAEEFSTRIGNADPWVGFDDGAYWEHRRRYLSRLRGVLPEEARIDVFLCLRDHESYAHALYATKVLSGQVGGGFGDFVRRCAPIFDYRRQVEVLAETLGPVRLQSFDALRGDLVNRSFASLGLPVHVENVPRLRPTPPLGRVHWLARAAASGMAEDERKRRATFCRVAPGIDEAVVRSLWASESERLDFLSRCTPPPLEGWASPVVEGRAADPALLERQADAIESEYRRWLVDAGRRRQLIYFGRSI